MKILAKLTILGLLIGFLGIQASEAPSSLQKEQNEQSFPIGALPEELQIMIFENIIPGSSSLEDAVQKIKSFMLVNRQYANYLDDEKTTERIIDALEDKWSPENWLKAAIYLGTKHAQAMIREDMQAEKKDENGNVLPESSVKLALYDLLLRAAKDGDLVVLKAIVALGLDLNRGFEQNGMTPLMFAAERGHLAAAQYLIDHGAKINAVDAVGQTALIFALANKKNDVAKFLILSGSNPNSASINGLTPLFIAIQNCDMQIFNSLLKMGANLYNVISQPGLMNGYNAIMIASLTGCGEILSQLLKDSKFNIDEQNSTGQTALMLASLNAHTEIVKKLLAAGARVDLQDMQGFSALFSAANKGYVDIVAELIKAGANVNLPGGEDKFTPLIAASGAGHKEVVKLLIDAGADIYAKSLSGNDVFFQATGGGHIEIARLLLDKGFDPQGSDSKGLSPLTLAANHGHIEMVELLIRKGADVDHASANGFTPLFGALFGSADMETKEKMVDLLLAADANPNTTIDVDGLGQNLTPLFVAINSLDLALVDKFLKAGADVNHIANIVINRQENKSAQRTPLMYAVQTGSIPIVERLLNAGANISLKDNLGQTAYRLAQSLAVSKASDTLEEQELARKMQNIVSLFEKNGIRE